MRVWLSLTSCLSVLACAAEPSELPVEEGERCHSSLDQCIDDEHILSCVERLWTAVPCVDTCGERESLGCEEGEGADRCACGPFGPGCPGGSVCVDAESVSLCDEDGMRVTVDCADRCGELVSLGCSSETWPADCQCSYEGVACEDEGWSVCDGASTVARCEGGAWSIEDCVVECGSEEATCDAWADAGATCSCG